MVYLKAVGVQTYNTHLMTDEIYSSGLKQTINALLHIQNVNVPSDNWTQTLQVN